VLFSELREIVKHAVNNKYLFFDQPDRYLSFSLHDLHKINAVPVTATNGESGMW
jgi:hypothetical protein